MIYFKNVAFFYHKVIYVYDNEYYAQPLWAVPINELSHYCQNLSLMCPVAEINQNDISNLKKLEKNISIVNIPLAEEGFLKKISLIKEIKKRIIISDLEKKYEFIYFECPSFYVNFVYKIFKNRSVFNFAGDLMKTIEQADTPLIKKIPQLIYWYIDKIFLSLRANKEIAFGGNYRGYLRGKYINQYRLVNDKTINMLQTFSNQDIISKKKLNSFPVQINILTCQRLDASTNTRQIISISEKLKNKGYKICWKIIGSVADYYNKDSSSIFEKFKIKIAEKKLEKNIILLGNIEHGKKFNEIVDSSHVYIAPNKITGGNIGRVGWEMMARGLPIISTPLTKRNFPTHKYDCLITNNGRDDEYINFFIHLFSDTEYYNLLSKNATNTAKNHTVEECTRRIVDHIYCSYR
jgi:glycosyltransferase involved in cell wall biosynthesis